MVPVLFRRGGGASAAAAAVSLDYDDPLTEEAWDCLAYVELQGDAGMAVIDEVATVERIVELVHRAMEGL